MLSLPPECGEVGWRQTLVDEEASGAEQSRVGSGEALPYLQILGGERQTTFIQHTARRRHEHVTARECAAQHDSLRVEEVDDGGEYLAELLAGEAQGCVDRRMAVVCQPYQVCRG